MLPSVTTLLAGESFVSDTVTVDVHCTGAPLVMPKPAMEGDAKSVAPAAATASTRPAPSDAISSPIEIAVDTSADLIWSGVQSGWISRRSAAMPATCGAAIDVP